MGHAKELGRGVARPKTVAVDVPRDTGSFAASFPRLQAFLEHPVGNSVGARTGCMTLFFEDGRYKLCLNDRPNNRSCFVSSPVHVECYRIAERGLQGNSLMWRTKGYKSPQQRELDICTAGP